MGNSKFYTCVAAIRKRLKSKADERLLEELVEAVLKKDQPKDSLSTEGTLQEEYEKQFPNRNQVNHPVHYQSSNKELNIECIDAMRAAFGDEAVRHFCICNAFKYTWRHQSKNGKQDIEKAQWYLHKYLELNK